MCLQYLAFDRFSREAGSCIAKKYEPDVHRVAAHIIRDRNCSAEVAMRIALNPHYRRHIRTFTPENCAELLEQLYQKYLKLSNECVERNERPLFQ